MIWCNYFKDEGNQCGHVATHGNRCREHSGKEQKIFVTKGKTYRGESRFAVEQGLFLSKEE